MKTVNDIIWSDLFDDEVRVTIYDALGVKLSSPCLRFEDEITEWKDSEVCSETYYPIYNYLDIFLNHYSEDVIDHDPT